jgi:hypothetical protein
MVKTARADAAGRFPIRIGPDQRHFVDGQGRPFLIQGDSAWSLMAQLTAKEAEVYLSRRQAQGFNAVLINLIERKFSKNAPRNAAGDAPFLKPGDLSMPNEAYFAQAEAVVRMARQKGMLVFLVPAYLGWQGGDEGWFREILENGPARLREYGRSVGTRFGRYDNLVWVLGGDYSPRRPDRWTVDALAAGLKDAGTGQLMTAHCGQESPAVPYGDRTWLDFDNVYSYEPDLYAVCLQEFGRKPPRPFILLEALYEGEHDAAPAIIRGQAYAAMLAGAAGQFFGNNPIWNFNAPVQVFPNRQPWSQALESQGAREIALMSRLFLSLPWADLTPVPPGTDSVLRPAARRRPGQPMAAAVDGSLIVVYVPGAGGGDLRMDVGKLARPGRAFWFDPTNGERMAIEPSAFSGQGLRTVRPPLRNAAGASDWVLVYQAERSSMRPSSPKGAR